MFGLCSCIPAGFVPDDGDEEHRENGGYSPEPECIREVVAEYFLFAGGGDEGFMPVDEQARGDVLQSRGSVTGYTHHAQCRARGFARDYIHRHQTSEETYQHPDGYTEKHHCQYVCWAVHPWIAPIR